METVYPVKLEAIKKEVTEEPTCQDSYDLANVEEFKTVVKTEKGAEGYEESGHGDRPTECNGTNLEVTKIEKDSEEPGCGDFEAVYLTEFDIKPDIGSSLECDKLHTLEEHPSTSGSKGYSRLNRDDMTELRRHVWSCHMTGRLHQCPHCNYSCVKGSSLKKHVLTKHSTERPHKCPHCDFAYVKAGRLATHIETKHTSEQPRQCPYCKYTNVKESYLKRHILSKHSLERPHRCPHCDFACAQEDQLKKHLQEEHTSERLHQCPHCLFASLLRAQLKQHIQEEHMTERPYKCPHCDYACFQRNSLKKHIQAKHKDEPVPL